MTGPSPVSPAFESHASHCNVTDVIPIFVALGGRLKRGRSENEQYNYTFSRN